jgi:superfamily II DNA or RNA helicase
MASEGLDIKSLSTLFMVTPMTKIEQSVGRILRQKHDFNPVVVDIIDTHANFQRQWLKRKVFFKSQNYKIIQTTSSAYDPDCTKWKVTYEPSDQPNLIKKQKVENKSKVSKTKTTSSRSSTEDTDEDISDFSEEEEEASSVGKCLLKFKK